MGTHPEVGEVLGWTPSDLGAFGHPLENAGTYIYICYVCVDIHIEIHMHGYSFIVIYYIM